MHKNCCTTQMLRTKAVEAPLLVCEPLAVLLPLLIILKAVCIHHQRFFLVCNCFASNLRFYFFQKEVSPAVPPDEFAKANQWPMQEYICCNVDDTSVKCTAWYEYLFVPDSISIQYPGRGYTARICKLTYKPVTQ